MAWLLQAAVVSGGEGQVVRDWFQVLFFPTSLPADRLHAVACVDDGLADDEALTLRPRLITATMLLIAINLLPG